MSSAPAASTIALVSTTLDHADTARSLAQQLVQDGLAACVEIEPIESCYRWQGRVEWATEWRLSCKTTTLHLDAVQRALRQRHPYELPEIVVHMAQADPSYAQWVHDSVHAAPTGD